MADIANAADPAGGDIPVADTKVPSDGDTPQSVREAARALSNWRNRPEPAAPTPSVKRDEESAPEAPPPADESADEAGTAPPQEGPGHDQEAIPAPSEPPI